MSYQIVWDEKAREFLRKLEKSDAQRIIKKANSIVNDPYHYLESLVGLDGYKLRVGDYRLIVDVNSSTHIIQINKIGHRKNIYQELR